MLEVDNQFEETVKETDRQNKILVVGGSGGIGKFIINKFYESGWKTANLSRKNVGSGDKCLFYPTDLSKISQIKETFKRLEKEFQNLDAVVNCAGIIQDQTLIKMSEPAWDSVLHLNLKAAFLITQLAAPLLEKNSGGHIVHMGSMSGMIGRFGQGNYAAAKAGLISLVKSAARELGEKNIRVNLVIPGFQRTPMTSRLSADQVEKIRRENVLGRIGTPEEVAKFVHFLCTTEHISGQVFNLDSRILPTW